METLRLAESPNNGEGAGKETSSRLYRIALEKKGIFRPGGVPIEYARMQVDTPGRPGEVWDHEWVRR